MVRNTVKKNAFTLIELLLTISIIAVLSTIGLTIYQGVQAKGRDSVRKRDLNNLATALEIYAQQHNGSYVIGSGTCNDTASFYTTMADYMSDKIVPQDPQGGNYCYISQSNGQSYTLCANLENEADPERNSLCPTGYDYGVIPK